MITTEKSDEWIVGSPGIPPGVLVCIRCGEPVAEANQYNEAEECTELGYHCFVCEHFTWKAKIRNYYKA